MNAVLGCAISFGPRYVVLWAGSKLNRQNEDASLYSSLFAFQNKKMMRSIAFPETEQQRERRRFTVRENRERE